MSDIIFIILWCYCAFCVAYIFICSIASLIYKRTILQSNEEQKSFAILIPAYKEDKVIIEVAKAATLLDYSPDKFQVFVIADTLKPETIEKIKDSGANVIEVVFESSTKAKALNAAMNQISDDCFDFVLIVDADNIMQSDFLKKMNHYAIKGFKAIQGHRAAKNTNTPTALLDAASEEMNNSLFRRALSNLGLSAMIIGSGYAVEYHLFKRVMGELGDVAGEDREFEIRLLKENIKIPYVEDALILDEKVQKWDVFKNQRTRWLAASFDFVRNYFIKDFFKLFSYNLDYFNKVVSSIIPPRAMFIFLLLIIALADIFLNFRYIYISWQMLFAINLLSLGIAIPSRFYTFKFVLAIARLPIWIFNMILSLFKIKGQSKKFIHTPHSID